MKKRVKKKYENALARYNRCTSARAKTLLGYACKFGYNIEKEDIRDENIYGFLRAHKRVYVYTDRVIDVDDEPSISGRCFRIDRMNLPIYNYKRERKYPDTIMQLVEFGDFVTAYDFIKEKVSYENVDKSALISSIHLYDIANSLEIWGYPQMNKFYVDPVYKSKYPKNIIPWDLNDEYMGILTSKIGYISSYFNYIAGDDQVSKIPTIAIRKFEIVVDGYPIKTRDVKSPPNIFPYNKGLINPDDLQVSDNISIPAIIATEPLKPFEFNI